MQKMNFLSNVSRLLAVALVAVAPMKLNAQIVFERSANTDFLLNTTKIIVDQADYPGVQRVANIFADDVNRVTGQRPEVATAVSAVPQAVIVGTIGKNQLIDKLVKAKKIDVKNVAGQWESTLIQIVDNPTKEIGRALVIAGADKRGTMYGMFHLYRYPFDDIAEVLENGVTVYPNPSHGALNIVSDKEIISVEVVDLSGRTVESFNSNTIDISHLNSGLYLLKISTLDNISITKVSIIH